MSYATIPTPLQCRKYLSGNAIVNLLGLLLEMGEILPRRSPFRGLGLMLQGLRIVPTTTCVYPNLVNDKTNI